LPAKQVLKDFVQLVPQPPATEVNIMNKSDLKSFDFIVDRFSMNLFKKLLAFV